MATGMTVRKVWSKDLLKYDLRRQEQELTWHDMTFDEFPLESGTGSSEYATHVRILNSNPSWKEMCNAQRKEFPESFCDVHLIGSDGYIPAHRVYLHGISDFLDELIKDNLRAAIPSGSNVITITLADVSIVHLKSVITLLYTGVCAVDEKDEQEVRNVLKLLTGEDKVKLDRIPQDHGKKRRAMRYYRDVEINTEGGGGGDAAIGNQPGGSRQTSRSTPPPPLPTGPPPKPSTPAKRVANATPRDPSTSASAGPRSSLAGTLPEVRKVPPGSLIKKKPVERIQRRVSKRTSFAKKTPCEDAGCSSQTKRGSEVKESVRKRKISLNKSLSTNAASSSQNKTDSDIHYAENTCPSPDLLPPVVMKVPPGSLQNLGKQPRIMRPECAKPKRKLLPTKKAGRKTGRRKQRGRRHPRKGVKSSVIKATAGSSQSPPLLFPEVGNVKQEKNSKKKLATTPEMEVVNLPQVSVRPYLLDDDQIRIIMEKVERGERVNISRPGKYNYVFNKLSTPGDTEIFNVKSIPEKTQPQLSTSKAALKRSQPPPTKRLNWGPKSRRLDGEAASISPPQEESDKEEESAPPTTAAKLRRSLRKKLGPLMRKIKSGKAKALSPPSTSSPSEISGRKEKRKLTLKPAIIMSSVARSVVPDVKNIVSIQEIIELEPPDKEQSEAPARTENTDLSPPNISVPEEMMEQDDTSLQEGDEMQEMVLEVDYIETTTTYEVVLEQEPPQSVTSEMSNVATGELSIVSSWSALPTDLNISEQGSSAITNLASPTPALFIENVGAPPPSLLANGSNPAPSDTCSRPPPPNDTQSSLELVPFSSSALTNEQSVIQYTTESQNQITQYQGVSASSTPRLVYLGPRPVSAGMPYQQTPSFGQLMGQTSWQGQNVLVFKRSSLHQPQSHTTIAVAAPTATHALASSTSNTAQLQLPAPPVPLAIEGRGVVGNSPPPPLQAQLVRHLEEDMGKMPGEDSQPLGFFIGSFGRECDEQGKKVCSACSLVFDTDQALESHRMAGLC